MRRHSQCIVSATAAKAGIRRRRSVCAVQRRPTRARRTSAIQWAGQRSMARGRACSQQPRTAAHSQPIYTTVGHLTQGEAHLRCVWAPQEVAHEQNSELARGLSSAPLVCAASPAEAAALVGQAPQCAHPLLHPARHDAGSPRSEAPWGGGGVRQGTGLRPTSSVSSSGTHPSRRARGVGEGRAGGGLMARCSTPWGGGAGGQRSRSV